MARSIVVSMAIYAGLGTLGCEGAGNDACASNRACAETCASFGLPTEGALCESGRCTCTDPSLADVGGPTDTGADRTDLDDADNDDADNNDAGNDTGEADGASRDDTPEIGDVDDRGDGGQADTGSDTDGGLDAANDEDGDDTSEDTAADARIDDAADVSTGPCPPEMVLWGGICMDRYEAPGVEGGLPFVMFSFEEAAGWCEARGKRLCFDDEWTSACEGPDQLPYPYGAAQDPGVCNDEELWRAYHQESLSAWPIGLPTAGVGDLEELLTLARGSGDGGKIAADHVEALYQAEPSGSNAGCVGASGVYDLTGNVEEWTRRRDGGEPSFHGNLKGRYWAETRTCQSNVRVHGDGFRFYEIGFRCCAEPAE